MRIRKLELILLGCILMPTTPVMAQERQGSVEDSEVARNRLLRTGIIRQASKGEDRAIRATIRAKGSIVNTMPFYVVRKPFAGLNAMNGGASVNFLVPWSVIIGDYGQTHSTFYRPSGICLHGASCPLCPDGTPASPMGHALDATPAGCIALPALREAKVD